MTIFNPDDFIHSVTNEQSKRRPPLNTNMLYTGTLGAPKGRSNPGTKDPSKTYTFYDFPVVIDLMATPGESDRLGTTTITLRYSASVDFNETGIDYSPGKSVGLRMAREATGLNVPGKPFSIASLEGRTVKVRIRHEEYPEGSGDLQDRIASLVKV